MKIVSFLMSITYAKSGLLFTGYQSSWIDDNSKQIFGILDKATGTLPCFSWGMCL